MILWMLGCWMDQDSYYETATLLLDQDQDGYTINDGDCNDLDPMIHPDADEICDEVDNDCNDLIDDEPVSGDRWYYDDDNDGCAESWTLFCENPESGYEESSGDCD